MFKKTLIILFSLGLIFTLVGLILAKGNVGAVLYSFVDDQEYELIEKQGEDLITEIQLDLTSSNVVFHHYEGSGYKIDYYESKNNRKILTVTDGVLKLKNELNIFNLSFFSFNTTSAKVKAVNVYIPSSFSGPVNVKVTSGKINLTNFDLISLNAAITSGSALLENLNITNDLTISNTSGNIRINNITAANLSANAVSGGIYLDNIVISENTFLTATSGVISVENSTVPKLTANMTSGSIKVLDSISDQVVVKNTSGKITVRIYGNPDDYTIKTKSTSGTVYFQDYKIGSGTYNAEKSKFIHATCTSGNIVINIVEP